MAYSNINNDILPPPKQSAKIQAAECDSCMYIEIVYTYYLYNDTLSKYFYITFHNAKIPVIRTWFTQEIRHHSQEYDS